jgi:hypothetical protein
MPFDFEHRAQERLAKKRQLKIGIVGFGTFGQFLAKRLVEAGHKVPPSSIPFPFLNLRIRSCARPPPSCPNPSSYSYIPSHSRGRAHRQRSQGRTCLCMHVEGKHAATSLRGALASSRPSAA